MSNFGFGTDRRVVLPGLNAKLSEVGALLCLSKIEELETLAGHRSRLSAEYRRLLPDWGHQKQIGQRLSYQFYPVVLPDRSADRRLVIECLRRDHDVETAHYFSPHLAEQPFFADTCKATTLGVTDDISSRIISLPLHDAFTRDNVSYVASALKTAHAMVKRGEAA
jgi:dTDP-4-amino-4,6-dideoxygalactose transaminase